METPKEYYYTYYSYEEYGRGYIGSRTCKCLPEKDLKYFGSFSDKTFKPTHKIILKDDYATREEAYADEIILQKYYKVVENLHFANKSYQTSTKFYVPVEKAIENGRMGGIKTKELGLGVHARTKQKIIEDTKKAGNKLKELGTGIFSFTQEQRIECSKNAYIYGLGKMTKEQRSEIGKKSGKKHYEEGLGIFSLSSEQKSEIARKTCLQRWKCTETGYVANAGNLSKYQKRNGIDTSKRIRIQ